MKESGYIKFCDVDIPFTTKQHSSHFSNKSNYNSVCFVVSDTYRSTLISLKENISTIYIDEYRCNSDEYCHNSQISRILNITDGYIIVQFNIDLKIEDIREIKLKHLIN